MTNEIKENADYKRLSCDEIKVLLDYITNLQEENKRLKEQKEHLLIDLEGESEYKVMCEKAIEYIKEHCIDDEFYVNLTNKEKHIFDVLSILQGKDKELKDNKNE